MCRQSGNLFRPNLFILMKHSDFKRTVIVVLVGIMALAGTARDGDKWLGSGEFNLVCPTYKGYTPEFSFQLTASRQINDYMGLGIGLGIQECFNFKTAPTIPIFARFHAEEYGRKWSPFLDFDLGYGLNTENFDAGHLILNPTVGIRYGSVAIGVGYRGTKIFKGNSDFFSSVNVRLAYYFGYHRSDSEFVRFLKRLEFGIDLGVRIPMGCRINEEHSEEVGNAMREASIKQHYPIGGDLNLSLMYPVTENLSTGIMIGLGVAHQTTTHKQSTIYLGENNGDYDYMEKDSNDATMIPIALSGKYRFREVMIADRFYPFARLDIGFAINDTYWDDETKTSFYWSPTVGMAMDVVAGKHSVELGLGYVPQCVERTSYIYNSGSNQFDYAQDPDNLSRTLGGLRISLGYTF